MGQAMTFQFFLTHIILPFLGVCFTISCIVYHHFHKQSENKQKEIDDKQKEIDEMTKQTKEEKEGRRITELGEIKEGLSELKKAMEGVRADLSNMASKEYVDNAIKTEATAIKHKEDLFEERSKAEIEKATNALNTANVELRTGKIYVRDVYNIFIASLTSLGLNERTIENLEKMINIKTDDYIKDYKGLK